MCLLIAAVKTFPSLAILKMGEDQNKDGGGIAYIEGGKIHFKKGLKAEEMMAYKDKINNGPVLMHFRLATVGGTSVELCHPFPVTTGDNINKAEGTATVVLGHNGHLMDWKKMMKNALKGEKLPKGPWSDTKAMAYLTAIYGTAFLELIDEKVFIFRSNGDWEIFGSGWHKETDGLFLSYNPAARAGYCGTRWGYKFAEAEDYYWENDSIQINMPCAD